ncbi:MAG: 30S ribosomal protein S14 [Pseudomonadota bacterium]
MAKMSMKQRELKREKTVQRFAEKRDKLKAEIEKSYAAGNTPWELLDELQKLPRNASPSRVTRRCYICGRSRGVYRKVGLCRIHFRELVLEGKAPGAKIASW